MIIPIDLKPLKATMPTTTPTILDQISAEKNEGQRAARTPRYRPRNSPQPLKGKPTTSGFLTRWRATTPSGTDDYASEAAATAIVNIHPITAKKTEKMIPISDFLYFMMLDRQAVTVSS